jgi:chaperonin GroES
LSRDLAGESPEGLRLILPLYSPPDFLAVMLIPPSTSAGLMEEMGGSVQISKSLEANLTFAGVMITFSPEIQFLFPCNACWSILHFRLKLFSHNGPPGAPYTLLRKGEGVMKIRPLQDRILVKRVEEDETTSGGIIIPDTAKEKPMEGKVVAVGKGKVSEDGKVMPLDVKKGDRILFGKYAGTEVRIEGEEHLIMREEDVLGVIEK